MSNRYLVKIAETLTAQEQAALANGRDRYAIQSGLGGLVGGMGGEAAGQVARLAGANMMHNPVGSALLRAAPALGAVGSIAGAVTGGVKAYRNNSAIASAGIKDPQAYDSTITAGGKKSYAPAFVMGGPLTAAETYYHNDLVEKSKARMLKGYGS